MSGEIESKEKLSEDFLRPKNKESEITIKKSTYNKMLGAMIVGIAFAAFFGGIFIGTMNDNDSGISSDDLKEILSEIQSSQKIAPQSVQQPTQPSVPQIFQVSLDDDPLKGDPNAPVTIVEFSDFQCPFCSRFFQQTLPLLDKNYIETGKVNLVYRDMPLDNLHTNARPASIAAECADEQGNFWEYHDILFANQGQWQRLPSAELATTFVGYASDLKIDTASFESCMSSPDMADEVNKDYLEGGQYGVTGTPTFFIGNEKDGFIKLVGAQPYSSFQRAIDSQLG